MKYLLVVYGNGEPWESFPADEWSRRVAAQDAFDRRHYEAGELIGAFGVGDAGRARTVRVRGGVPEVLDGPYRDTDEYLAGWYLLDVEDERRALDIAAELPMAAVRQVEVWPLLHDSAAEM